MNKNLTIRQWFRRLSWRVRKWLAVKLADFIYGEDLLWDVDDPEQPIYSIDEWASDVWGPTTGGQETTATFSRALTLPTHKVRIRSIAYEDKDDIDFQITRLK